MPDDLIYHTPGPWRMHPSGKPNILGDHTIFHGPGESAFNQICSASLENARLITAAPELLAAAQRFMEFALSGDRFIYPPGSLQQLDIAITKATGNPDPKEPTP